ncbi:MAG: 4Fe-4S dicluster domain-containing protein [Desulfamplus sp.]|nr:4Fe-4S dicluster domain-containing protein [Desulfamplus sp.]
MKLIHIDKKEWNQGMERAQKEYLLFSPVKDKDKEQYLFGPLAHGEVPDMTHADTVLSPKSIIFPQTEKMLHASLDPSQPDHHIMKRVPEEYGPRAVIGIRPYDVKALTLMNLNFDTDDYRDPYWCDAYKATTFIALGVNSPSSVDFSTSMGSGPFDETGVDVLLVDNQDSYIAKIITDKGQAFMEAAGFNAEADPSARETLDNIKANAEKKITAKVGTDTLRGREILELYEAPFWDEIAFSCINCGTCTFVCPTCWCFDIQDETKGKACTRFRNWDSCMFPLFTLHGSGHNPRGEKTQRVRQRFMHKLKYFLDKYDQGTMCVGCGRCVESCPVNIDIREVCNIMNNYEPQK